MRRRFCVVLCVLFMACWCRAENTQISGRYDVVKAENGLIIGWRRASEDRATQQISIFDMQGKFLIGLTPLRLVPEAKRATIYDVSALPGRLIAVAVVYRKSEDTAPAASLLYFDFQQGSPLLALALDPSREVLRLTVDDDSDVWTLTEGVGEKKPSEQPMIVGYGPSGDVLKEVGKRSEFPLSENQEDGAGFGHTRDSIWFWLPGSTDFVTIKSHDTSLNRFVTGRPNQSPLETTVRAVRTEKGTLLAEILSSEDELHRGHFNFFSRSATTNEWKPFSPPCSPCTLIGTDNGQALFVETQADHLEVYAAPISD